MSAKFSNAFFNPRTAHNPYDKFPADQFDNWINGLKNTLKGALHHQPLPPPSNGHTKELSSESFASGQEHHASPKLERRIITDSPSPSGQREEPIEISSSSEDEGEDWESDHQPLNEDLLSPRHTHLDEEHVDDNSPWSPADEYAEDFESSPSVHDPLRSIDMGHSSSLAIGLPTAKQRPLRDGTESLSSRSPHYSPEASPILRPRSYSEGYSDEEYAEEYEDDYTLPKERATPEVIELLSDDDDENLTSSNYPGQGEYYGDEEGEDELDQDFVPQQNNQPHQFKLHDGSLSELAAAEDTNSWFSQSSRHSPSPELDRTQRGDGMHFQPLSEWSEEKEEPVQEADVMIPDLNDKFQQAGVSIPRPLVATEAHISAPLVTSSVELSTPPMPETTHIPKEQRIFSVSTTSEPAAESQATSSLLYEIFGSTIGSTVVDNTSSPANSAPLPQTTDEALVSFPPKDDSHISRQRSTSVEISFSGTELEEQGMIYIVEPTPEPEAAGSGAQGSSSFTYGQYLTPVAIPESEGLPEPIPMVDASDSTSTSPFPHTSPSPSPFAAEGISQALVTDLPDIELAYPTTVSETVLLQQDTSQQWPTMLEDSYIPSPQPQPTPQDFTPLDHMAFEAAASAPSTSTSQVIENLLPPYGVNSENVSDESYGTNLPHPADTAVLRGVTSAPTSNILAREESPRLNNASTLAIINEPQDLPAIDHSSKANNVDQSAFTDQSFPSRLDDDENKLKKVSSLPSMPEDLPLSTYDIPNQTTSLEPISDVAAGGSIPLSNGHSLSLSPKSDTDVDLPLLPGFTGHVNVDGGSNSEQEESRSDGGPDIIYSSAVTPQAALEAEDFVSETSLLADHAHEDMPRYETWLLEPPQDIFVTDTSSPYLEPESEAGQTAVNVQVGLDINVDGDEDSERVPPQPGSSAVDEVLEDVTVEEDGQNMVVNSQSDLIVESFNKSSNIVDPTHPHPDASTDKDSLFGDESSEIPDVGASEAAIDQQVAERQQHTNDEQADIDDHDSLFDGPTPPQETMDYQIEGYQSEKRPEQAGNSGLKVRDKVAGLSPALDEASQSPVNGTLGLDHSHRLKFAVSAEAASNSVVSLQPQANNSPNDQTALSTGQTSPQPHKSLRSKRKRENSGKLNSRSVRTKFPETMIEDGPSTSLTTSTSPAKTKSQRRRQTSPAAESASGSSDASHVARLLEQDSREASPGLYRPNAPGPIPLPHLLFHNHGNRRSSSLLTTMPKLHTSRPSPHRSQTTASQALTSTKTPDSSPTKGALLHFAPTSSSPASPSTPTMPISPVTPSLTGTPDISSLHPTQRATRSNCRYHNISLPSTDEQTRVHFLVPGCSLSNREVISEENIEDHGLATLEDSSRIVDRIESHFDAYLIGNIRKLVGVDLIRENEIYWLPRPGQNVPPATRRVEKKHSKRASKQFADSDRNGPLSPQLSFTSSGSRSSRAPVSNAGSTSTTANLVLDRLGEDAPSELDEDVQSPVSDNRWTTHESAVAGPSSTPLDAQNGKRKRGRGHLSADASAYVPQDEQESSSEDGEPQNKKKVLKRKRSKRVKAQLDADTELGESRPTKKSRVRRRTSSKNVTAESQPKVQTSI